MQEVKPPRKPLVYYYVIALLVLLFLQFLAMPWLVEGQIQQVDYNTFNSMIENGEIGQVEIQEQDNRILFTNKEGTAVYKTAMLPDDTLTERLLDAGVSTSGVEIEQTSLLAKSDRSHVVL